MHKDITYKLTENQRQLILCMKYHLKDIVKELVYPRETDKALRDTVEVIKNIIYNKAYTEGQRAILNALRKEFIRQGYHKSEPYIIVSEL